MEFLTLKTTIQTVIRTPTEFNISPSKRFFKPTVNMNFFGQTNYQIRRLIKAQREDWQRQHYRILDCNGFAVPNRNHRIIRSHKKPRNRRGQVQHTRNYSFMMPKTVFLGARIVKKFHGSIFVSANHVATCECDPC